MEEAEKVAQKLKRSPGAILTDREIRLLVEATAQFWRENFPQTPRLPSGDIMSRRFEDSFRWDSVGVRCRQARERRKLDLKAAGKGVRLARYRVEAIEKGQFTTLLPDEALRYFAFLGIEAWVRRWCRSNRELADRVGIAPIPRQGPRKRHRNVAVP